MGGDLDSFSGGVTTNDMGECNAIFMWFWMSRVRDKQGFNSRFENLKSVNWLVISSNWIISPGLGIKIKNV